MAITQKDPIALELKELLGSQFQKLSKDNKIKLCHLYKKNKKTDFILLFWLFNLHYAYVKKWKIFFIFFLTIGGLCVWWIIDFFRLDTILLQYNKNKAQELLNKL